MKVVFLIGGLFPPLPRISQALSLFVIKAFLFTLFAFHAFQLLHIFLVGLSGEESDFFGYHCFVFEEK